MIIYFDREEIGEVGDAGGGVPAEAPVETVETPTDESDDVSVTPMEEAPEETADGDAADAAASAYTPNFKFKVLDSEKEIPEWARPFIQDADSEAKFRELFEKSEGIEHVKASRQQVQTQLETVGTKFTQQNGAIQQMNGLLQKGDFQSFFEALQVPEEAVLRYALNRINLLQNPEAAQQHEMQRQQQMQMQQLQQQVQGYQGYAQTLSVNQRTQELDIQMARPEVSSLASAYDARAGRPGAFKAEVVNRGKFHAYQGRDISADQAVKEVMAMLGPVGGQPNGGAPVSQTGTAGQPISAAPQAPAKKPVIPNIAGNGTSPAQVVPRSIKQLREIGQSMRR